MRAEAKEKGDKALMQAVQVFGDKRDGDRFRKALALLDEAREGFRYAGSDVERERDAVMGNLFSAILSAAVYSRVYQIAEWPGIFSNATVPTSAIEPPTRAYHWPISP